jgi:plastocyanin
MPDLGNPTYGGVDMRRRLFGRLGILGGVTAVAVASALVLAGQSAAQFPYPSYPTTPSSSPSTGAPTSNASSSKKKHHVTIAGTTDSTYAFAPKKLKIKKGQTVNWSWMSNAAHNVTFTSLGKHSSTGASGSFKLKFSKKGTFNYLCTIHGFQGKIVVK